jgi:hypothetical protein
MIPGPFAPLMPSLEKLGAVLRRNRLPIAAVMVLASVAGGTLSGMADAREDRDSYSRHDREEETKTALIEEVAVLADLDARVDGSWDTYLTEYKARAMVKGGITRTFAGNGPTVSYRMNEPRYARTLSYPVAHCRPLIEVMAAGPLSDRIEVSVADEGNVDRLAWSRIDDPNHPCSWSRTKGNVAFRIAPPTQREASLAGGDADVGKRSRP